MKLRLDHDKSKAWIERSSRSIAGGESSSARVSSMHVPTAIVSGEGARITDADGNTYIDFQAAYGPLLFGHRHPRIIDAVVRQAKESGTLFSMPHALNFEVGEHIVDLVPGIDLLRFANSGTEALASAVRLARAATGRRLVLKFEGHYHGWSDGLFAKLHPTLAELGPEDSPQVVPRTSGLPDGCLDDLQQRSWNSRDLVLRFMQEQGSDVACIICEPVMGNSGIIEPEPGFLSFLREVATAHGALLLFDEVITGFRLAAGGAQERYDVLPDLTVIAKAVGGGLPVAAFGGRADIMQLQADGRAFHGGTYAGNPMALAGARATLGLITDERETLYPTLERHGERLANGLKDAVDSADLPAVVNQVGGMLQLFFTQPGTTKICSYRDAVASIVPGAFSDFQNALQDEGVYVHPDQFECFFITAAHSDEDIDYAVEAAGRAAQRVRIDIQ